ncbi:hypothetical protein DFR74_102326 [Nocardia puris]|uniref:Uncharacterized protein n=1 Tax=Nocardia puris TaxID=208602 RepID=A0A366DUY5_9NOCA|nr:hypothetical protein DFR74_102326 [Nocardia puris]
MRAAPAANASAAGSEPSTPPDHRAAHGPGPQRGGLRTPGDRKGRAKPRGRSHATDPHRDQARTDLAALVHRDRGGPEATTGPCTESNGHHLISENAKVRCPQPIGDSQLGQGGTNRGTSRFADPDASPIPRTGYAPSGRATPMPFATRAVGANSRRSRRVREPRACHRGGRHAEGERGRQRRDPGNRCGADQFAPPAFRVGAAAADREDGVHQGDGEREPGEGLAHHHRESVFVVVTGAACSSIAR